MATFTFENHTAKHRIEFTTPTINQAQDILHALLGFWSGDQIKITAADGQYIEITADTQPSHSWVHNFNEVN